MLEREIGAGGMALVFLGWDEVLDRPVAVKILRGGFEDSEVSARFRREGRTAARLSHPNIVPVYDAGEGELEGREVSYIVMEYVSGGDLKALIDTEGSLSNERLARLGAEASLGLAHAHEKGVIHRDIKPHNILIDSQGHPKLADFGIARALGATQATQTGSYLGTALYSSPEQLQGEKVTPKSDVYSLGIAFYQAAVGEPPFTGSPIAVASQHINQAPNKPSALGARLSGQVEALILDCVQKEPDLRPNAEEVHERLQGEARRPHRSIRGAYAAPLTFEPTPTERTHPAPTEDAPATPPPAAEPPTTERTRAAAPEAPTTGPPPGDVRREGRRRRAPDVLAAAALLLVVLGVATVFAALGGGDSDSAQAPQEESIEQAAPPADGGESVPEEPPVAAAAVAGGDQGSSDAGVGAREEAAQAVEAFYTAAAEGNGEGSWDFLSSGFRQRAGSRNSFTGQFSTLQEVEFTEGPRVIESIGDTSTVSFSTVALHDWGTDPKTGTATLVREGGEWKIDNLNVQTA